mmetsp:Transcript_14348/g.23454  ORF Transcript_14348/g.23454 Transcript_14348/m.23454 type:complete len:134 (-) Transcript_14348:107-508(-)|eukprot:CAMPEP_0169109766 /NCGR_PEP_ID=MMETSP1015-20121227/26141_1 /TAXON_ID=342587 /ORGANISM="Karlodinium micrum, Strain CCMP2283" /LENGTH=133 /DNA_ID=CAMNT_0009171487 /DNA_START=76 /DNA_END=477 /DNA_ORIENTATION=-
MAMENSWLCYRLWDMFVLPSNEEIFALMMVLLVLRFLVSAFWFSALFLKMLFKASRHADCIEHVSSQAWCDGEKEESAKNTIDKVVELDGFDTASTAVPSPASSASASPVLADGAQPACDAPKWPYFLDFKTD